jgi:hypothetical protein
MRLIHVLLKYNIMEYIKKENGNVWLVIEHDVYGKHKTVRYLGKEFVELDEINDDKPKKKRKGNV